MVGGRGSGRCSSVWHCYRLSGMSASEGSDASSQARLLWSPGGAYAGDNSREIALVRGVGPAPEGRYQIRLHTAKRPYALTIDIRRLDKPFDDTDFDRQTTLLLGLVGNLDKVSVTSGGGLLPDDRVVLPRARVRREGAGPGSGQAHAYLDASRD